jgi:molybdenum cofactor cytidylyltransferase
MSEVAGLVPAAGASRRMGRDKRLLVVGERTVLEAAVGALQQGGIDRVVVVLEPGSPCRQLPGLRATLLAENPAPERGMLSSIRVGLARLPQEAAAAAVLPGDHPFVPPEAVAALVQHFRRHRPLLLAPRYAGRRGHPLILARELFAEAAACSDAVGLRELVWRREAELVLLDVAGVERDLDTPEDLEG